MALAFGRYVASLYGWELERTSGRRRARVDIERDGASYATVIFGLNGPAFPRIRSFVDPGASWTPDGRTMQALTMIVQNRVRDALSHGEELPDGVEMSEEEILTAIQYVKAPEDLDVSFAPATILWDITI